MNGTRDPAAGRPLAHPAPPRRVRRTPRGGADGGVAPHLDGLGPAETIPVAPLEDDVRMASALGVVVDSVARTEASPPATAGGGSVRARWTCRIDRRRSRTAAPSVPHRCRRAHGPGGITTIGCAAGEEASWPSRHTFSSSPTV